MSKKITQEEFLTKCQEVHSLTYDYSKTVYQGALRKVIVSCLIHGDFAQRAHHHLKGNGCPKCHFQKMIVNQDDFIQKCQERHQGKYNYDLTIYTGSKNKITIICSIHGKFCQIADDHVQGHGCSKCGISKISDKLKMSFQEFVAKANEIHNKYHYFEQDYSQHSIENMRIFCSIHGEFWQRRDVHLNGHGCQACANCKPITFDDIFIRSKECHGNKYQYLNNQIINDHIVITCNIHGDFKQRYHDHIRGHGCAACAFEKNANDKRLTTDQFIERAKSVHLDIYDYSSSIYLGFNKNITISCKKHGIFNQRAENHLNGHGCPTCCHNISKSETLWLDHLNVDKEYRQFKIIIKDKKYKVDGFDPLTNTVYEFNGDFWHGNPDKYHPQGVNCINHKTFGKLYNNTINKEKILKEAGYQIISIWESDFNNKTNIVV